VDMEEDDMTTIIMIMTRIIHLDYTRQIIIRIYTHQYIHQHTQQVYQLLLQLMLLLEI